MSKDKQFKLMNKSERINILKELAKEHKELWEERKDDISPKIINDTIKFIQKLR